MKLNKNKEKEKIQAARIFTDRTEPRKAFWDKYNYMKENINNLDDVYIFNYYGVGGIGKSSLLRKIEKELESSKDKNYFAFCDLETKQDVYTILKTLRISLIEKYKFDFPKFDIALLCYAKKAGDKADKEEIQSLVEKSRTLSLILDATGLIPQLSIASSLIKVADSGVAWVRNLADKNYKTEVAKLENMTASEIVKKLPYYFALDMSKNLEKLNKPFVIFIDTYEKLVNTISDDSKAFIKDLWLRDDEGLVLNMPKVLWVIAGREKLSWDKYNPDWKDSIESHILGDLDYNDAANFLKEAGFSDEDMCKSLYSLTNGTPIYLDICVSTLEKLLNNGEEVTIDKFGTNTDELLERFIRYMDVQTREITHVLCLIGTWNDDLINNVASKILPSFSSIIYDILKDSSFIIKDKDYYYVHKTVKDVINKECPSLIRNNYNKVMYDYLLEKIEDYNATDNMSKIYLDMYLDIVNATLNDDNTNQYIIDFLGVYNDLMLATCDDLADEIFALEYKKFSKVKNCFNFYMLEAYYAKKLEDNLERKKLKHQILDYMKKNNIVDLSTIYELNSSNLTISDFSKSELLKLSKFIESVDLKKDIQFKNNEIAGYEPEAYRYIVTISLYKYLKPNVKTYIKLIDDIIKNVKCLKDKAYVLSIVIDYIDEEEFYDYYTQINEALEICYEYFQNLNHKEYKSDDMYLIFKLSGEYLRLGNKNKSLLLFNAGKKLINKFPNPYDYFYKPLILTQTYLLDTKEQKEYCQEQYNYIIENFDYNNYEIEKILLCLVSRYDVDKYDKYVKTLFVKYKNDINITLDLWEMNKYNVYLPYLGMQIEKYERTEITDENINEFDKLLSPEFVKTNDVIKEKTLKIYDKMYDYYAKKYGKNSDELYYFLDAMAVIYLNINDEKIVDKVKEKINIAETIYGKDSLETIESLQNLAVIYNEFGQYEESLKIGKSMLEICEKNKDIIFIYDMLFYKRQYGLILSYIDNEKSIAYFENMIKDYEEFFQKNEYDYINTLYDLNIRKCESKDLSVKREGIKGLEKVYESLEKLLPINCDKMLKLLENISNYSYEEKDYNNSLVYRKKLNAALEKENKNSNRYLKNLHNMSYNYYHLSQYEEELKILKEIYPTYVKKYGNNDEETIKVVKDLAITYANNNDYEYSIFYRKQLNDILEKNSDEYLKNLYSISDDYYYLKKYDEELKILKEIYPVYIEKHGVVAEQTIKVAKDLAEAYYNLEDYDNYVIFKEKLYNELKDKIDEKALIKLKISMTRGYCRIGKEDEALNIIKNYPIKKEDYTNSEYVTIKNDILITLNECKKKKEAIEVAKELKKFIEDNFEPGKYQKTYNRCLKTLEDD